MWVKGTFKIYCLKNCQILYTLLSVIVTTQCNKFQSLLILSNWNCPYSLPSIAHPTHLPPRNHYSTFCLYKFNFCTLCVLGRSCTLFSVWNISHRIMSSKFMSVIRNNGIFFFWKSELYFSTYSCHNSAFDNPLWMYRWFSLLVNLWTVLHKHGMQVSLHHIDFTSHGSYNLSIFKHTHTYV